MQPGLYPPSWGSKDVELEPPLGLDEVKASEVLASYAERGLGGGPSSGHGPVLSLGGALPSGWATLTAPWPRPGTMGTCSPPPGWRDGGACLVVLRKVMVGCRSAESVLESVLLFPGLQAGRRAPRGRAAQGAFARPEPGAHTGAPGLLVPARCQPGLPVDFHRGRPSSLHKAFCLLMD